MMMSTDLVIFMFHPFPGDEVGAKSLSRLPGRITSGCTWFSDRNSNILRESVKNRSNGEKHPFDLFFDIPIPRLIFFAANEE